MQEKDLILQGAFEIKELLGQFIVDESGKKKAVILPMKDYEELFEDLHDLAIIAERKDESTVSFDDIKKRLVVMLA